MPLSLECLATGTPPPKMQWFLDERPLLVRLILQSQRHSLLITLYRETADPIKSVKASLAINLTCYLLPPFMHSHKACKRKINSSFFALSLSFSLPVPFSCETNGTKKSPSLTSLPLLPLPGTDLYLPPRSTSLPSQHTHLYLFPLSDAYTMTNSRKRAHPSR